MKKSRGFRSLLPASAVTIGLLFAATPPVYAARLVAVLFTGFSASSGSSDDSIGMETLNTTLQNTFGGNPNMPFSSEVFSWTEAQAAFNFINGFNDICHLVLIGHSFGGDTAIDDLATDLLLPNNQTVDLIIQIESVGIGDNQLPGNVKKGINYFQPGLDGDILFRETNVVGAMNINAEQLLGKELTHTNIDNDPDLYQQIITDMRKSTSVPESNSTLSLLTIGTLGAASTLKRKHKQKSTEKETTKVG